MKNILIIEDEEPSSKRLVNMLKEIEPELTVTDIIPSVADGLKWFKNNPAPGLIISDIQLADGLSFEIFKAINVDCPIIFTTAYDLYALDAFSVNGIAYLLKPIKKDELQKAVNKYKLFSKPTPVLDINQLLQSYNQTQKPQYKTRFIVRYGEHIKTINIEEVVYFYTEDKINFLCTKEGRRYAIDFNLDTLENTLNPKVFFRINRQYIIAIYSIAEMFSYSKSRVLIKLNPPAKHETIVSTERSGEFKLWLDDENTGLKG